MGDTGTLSDVSTKVTNLYLITILEGKIPRMGGVRRGLEQWSGKEFIYAIFWKMFGE